MKISLSLLGVTLAFIAVVSAFNVDRENDDKLVDQLTEKVDAEQTVAKREVDAEAEVTAEALLKEVKRILAEEAGKDELNAEDDDEEVAQVAREVDAKEAGEEELEQIARAFDKEAGEEEALARWAREFAEGVENIDNEITIEKRGPLCSKKWLERWTKDGNVAKLVYCFIQKAIKWNLGLSA